MGSLEEPDWKRNNVSSSSSNWSSAMKNKNRTRPKLERRSTTSFFRFKSMDYIQWIATIAVFLFVVLLFQSRLPSFLDEEDLDLDSGEPRKLGFGGVELVKDELKNLSFGDDDDDEGRLIMRYGFVAGRMLEGRRISKNRNGSLEMMVNGGRAVVRTPLRMPTLALVFPDLWMDDVQLMMLTIASALRELGYEIQVFSSEDGPVHEIWRAKGFPVSILQTVNKRLIVDWLMFDCIFANSLASKEVVSSLMQEPFKSLPLLWFINDGALSPWLVKFSIDENSTSRNEWMQLFRRATTLLFPNYVLPMMYSDFDSGNFVAVPSPIESWEAFKFMALEKGGNFRAEIGYKSNDFVVVVVGSPFSYNGMWLEHALILKALVPLLAEFGPHTNFSTSHLKVTIIGGNSTSNYKLALQKIALKLGYPEDSVQHVGTDGEVSKFLSISDVLIYGTFQEEHSFPSILIRAMCFEKPIIAPDLETVKKHVHDMVNGFIFPKDNLDILTQIMFQVVSDGKLSPVAQKVALNGKKTAGSFMVLESVEGYAALLEHVLHLPSEVAYPKPVMEIPESLKENWLWYLAEEVDPKYWRRSSRSVTFPIENFHDNNHSLHPPSSKSILDEVFSLRVWLELKVIEKENAKRQREEEEVKDRVDQPRGTWEEVYRIAKRADRTKNELHERDSRELERIGQALCIYEPYLGEGAWPFLHDVPLYRGIGLTTRGRRPGGDDVDASSRLPLLSNSYYRDVLGEYGAFFAIANRIDRIHKNAWIGSQSWRAAARKMSLSKTAEKTLLEAMQTNRHGDTLYFWANLDNDTRNSLHLDFWTFCDAVNAGNCRFAVSNALRRMYGVREDYNALPTMPDDGDTWSVMHSWALPTRSFVELIMFARMFVDSLDAEFYDEHHASMTCYLSLQKILQDRHCYSRILELIINVWAYHSARRMVYVNPETGAMQEHHKLRSRQGQMWIRWFGFSTLKSMDEELAEEADSDHPDRRWIWPLTGEVYWQGVYERERALRSQKKAEKKQRSAEKIRRIRGRVHQKTLGKYVKPPVEDVDNRTVI